MTYEHSLIRLHSIAHVPMCTLYASYTLYKHSESTAYSIGSTLVCIMHSAHISEVTHLYFVLCPTGIVPSASSHQKPYSKDDINTVSSSYCTASSTRSMKISAFPISSNQ